MSKWTDTSTTFENDGTFSKNVIDFEEPKNTFDLEFDENTASEALEKDVTWEQLQQQNLEPPKIRVFDVAAYILEKMDTDYYEAAKTDILQSGMVVGLG